MIPFLPGQPFRRGELHVLFKGQVQGGISTPAQFPLVFLFTGESGSQYGYRDHFLEDGTFAYTGEGTRGDMTFSAGNLALRDHLDNGERVFLFEILKDRRVQLMSEVRLLTHHFEPRPDFHGNLRRAIVFQLELITSDMPSDSTSARAMVKDTPTLKLSLEELRRRALQPPPPKQEPEKERLRQTFLRSAAVRLYALKRENGECPGCGKPAPFKAKFGPFLEVHHLDRVADGGPDVPSGVVAICPNCHREVHSGIHGAVLNNSLKNHVAKKEAELAKRFGVKTGCPDSIV